MPPRFAYWTIILDGAPTSFRAREQAEILPIFNQLKRKNPAAQLKWFSGGKLWDSPEQAREERQLARVREFRAERSKEVREERAREEQALAEFRRQHGRPADGRDQRVPRGEGAAFGPTRPKPAPRSDRSKAWRPGGDHKDPRDKYKLPPGEARKRWKERHLGGKAFEGKPSGPVAPGSKPWDRKPGGGKPFGAKRFGNKPGGPHPSGPHPSGPRSSGPRPSGPHPSGPRSSGPRPSGPRPQGPRSFDRRPPRGPGRRGPR
jgi:23S rRNA pseudouridine2605 synthase